MPDRQFAPATERNRAPILEVLRRVLPSTASILEIASGSGQHAVYFAESQPRWTWQPSDYDAAGLDSQRAWREQSRLSNVLEPIRLDVHGAWPQQRYDAVFCANMIHIAPWSATVALFSHVGRVLSPGGLVVTYGPYRVGGNHTSPSNESFERWLHSLSPEFGVRDVAQVEEQAQAGGLSLIEQVPMPANNFCLVFKRGADRA